MMNTLQQRVRVGFALIAASLFVLTLTAYGREAAKGPKAAAAEQISPVIREALERKVDLQFDGMPISDVVAFLQEIGGINIVLFPQDLASDEADWTVWDSETPLAFGNASTIFESTVTLKHKGTLAGLLDEACEMLGLAWKVDREAILIGSPERFAAPTRTRVGRIPPDIRKKLLNTTVSIEFDWTPLENAVDFLREVTGINFVVYRPDIPPGWAPVTLYYEGGLEQALDLICELAGMAWKVEDGAIKIGGTARLRSGLRPRVGDIPPHMQRKLATAKVSLDFYDMSLASALGFLRRSTGVEFALDLRDVPPHWALVNLRLEGSLEQAINIV
ncbi:MAG: hypothetical protein QGH74_06200, partial [Candidatus Brocadiia bacterium]|nr:hypothetical protein [Candidatus Brocadiia bacterium]